MEEIKFPITISIKKNEKEYLLLKKTILFIKLKI